MRNLYVQHDARALARLAGAAQAPGCDSIILRHGDPSSVLATVHHGNPLHSAEPWLLDLDAPAKRTLAWSGTLAGELFAADPRTWLRPGREAFARLCDDLEPQLLAHRRTVCFHPHARHVLNDVPSCAAFLGERAGRGSFEVALAPACMLEPAMLGQIDDHLRRQFEALGPVCALVLLSDVRAGRCDGGDAGEGEGEDRCEPVPLGDGALPRELVLRLLRECVPAATPVVIQGRSLAQQLQWLEHA